MKSLVFSLACFLIVGCGSSKKGATEPRMDADTSRSQEAGASTPGVLQAIYEIREQDGDRKVGMIYKRDHGEGKIVYWVYDAAGSRRGFVTPDGRAFAYDYILGKRAEKAKSIGSDTVTASSRRIIGHDRAVKLVEIDIDTWANPNG